MSDPRIAQLGRVRQEPHPFGPFFLANRRIIVEVRECVGRFPMAPSFQGLCPIIYTGEWVEVNPVGIVMLDESDNHPLIIPWANVLGVHGSGKED